MLLYQSIILRKDLKRNPECLYVFGDNLRRVGMGGQAYEMRGEVNAIGIPTKRFPSMDPSAFLKDTDYDAWQAAIADDVALLREYVFTRSMIVWPAAGLGTGRARLAQSSPQIWSALEELRRSLE